MFLDPNVFLEQLVARVDARVTERLGELERRLADRNQAELLDTNALAKVLGCSPRALRARLKRGSQLAGIALRVDGRRMWRRSDVEASVARTATR